MLSCSKTLYLFDLRLILVGKLILAFGTYHRLEIWLNLVCIEITNMRLIEIFASIVHNLVHTGLNRGKNVAFDAHYMHHFTFANFGQK